MGGAVRITTASSRATESLNLETQPMAGTTSLEVVMTSQGPGAASNPGACGVGVYDSGTTASYVIMQQLRDTGAPLVEAGYSAVNAQTFLANAAFAGMGNSVHLRIAVSGTTVTTSYSATGGPNSWVPINSRTLAVSGMPASVNQWAFFGEPAGTSAVRCQLLSWKVQ